MGLIKDYLYTDATDIYLGSCLNWVLTRNAKGLATSLQFRLGALLESLAVCEASVMIKLMSAPNLNCYLKLC